SAGGSNRLDPEEDGWRWESSTHRVGDGGSAPELQVGKSADKQVDRSPDLTEGDINIICPPTPLVREHIITRIDSEAR
ncbi:hypothetical protein Bbelb_174570, partial [Branchiostoma belcheri]